MLLKQCKCVFSLINYKHLDRFNGFSNIYNRSFNASKVETILNYKRSQEGYIRGLNNYHLIIVGVFFISYTMPDRHLTSNFVVNDLLILKDAGQKLNKNVLLSFNLKGA